MPFIHIRSLPTEEPLDVEAVIQRLSGSVAEQADIALAHLSVTWQTLAPGHYAVGASTAAKQPEDTHPLLVDFITPDFYAEEKIETALQAIADGLASVAGVNQANIFIQHRTAASGRVFDQGRLVRW